MKDEHKLALARLARWAISNQVEEAARAALDEAKDNQFLRGEADRLKDEISRLEGELELARKLLRGWEDLSARRAELLHRDTPKNRLVVEIRELRTENARLLADLTLERAKANQAAPAPPPGDDDTADYP